MVSRMKLVVAYFGRPFHGWQRQSGQKTVQGELEKALFTLVGGPPMTVIGAGRTDAGVHAAGQVAHVDLPSAIPPDGLQRGVNKILPPEIRIVAARAVSTTFHARRNARGKLYVYRGIWNLPRFPWNKLRSVPLQRIKDERSFSDGASLFVGRHDFASFTVPNPATDSTVRTIFRVQFQPRHDGFEIRFWGEGFLRYQVRRMVGALLEVGRGRRSIEQLRQLIEDPTPGAPLQTAPASGLSLEHVYYRGGQFLEKGAADHA